MMYCKEQYMENLPELSLILQKTLTLQMKDVTVVGLQVAKYCQTKRNSQLHL